MAEWLNLLPQEVVGRVRRRFEGLEGSHDFEHVLRVGHLAGKLAQMQQANLQKTAWIALLHDWTDRKLSPDPTTLESLLSLYCASSEASEITREIESISFSKNQIPATLEGQIVSDADRLDALGAVGIARCFAYGGSRGAALWDGQSRASKTSLGHFWEKLLELDQTLYTDEAKAMARPRVRFLHQFLLEFDREWHEG